MKKNTNYILFWLSQSISELGSAMTSFALIIWLYEMEQSAFLISLLLFCDYVPYILVSILAGTIIDCMKKKTIMLIADAIAAIGSITVLLLYINQGLQSSYWMRK